MILAENITCDFSGKIHFYEFCGKSVFGRKMRFLRENAFLRENTFF